MKKIIFCLFLFFTSLSLVKANDIDSIDIDVYIDELGNANITEVWEVDGSDGTEWYKYIKDMGNMKLSNFKVSMDGKALTYKDWDVDESLSEKKGYYGINYISDGLELCFGKYDYNSHTFTLSYTLSNVIFNTSDSQVLYTTFIDSLTNVDFKDFSLTISSFYKFPDTLDVWGYGYKGYAYVENGKIKMSNEGDMGDNYAVLLVKFPSNTFNTNNSYSQYDSFNSVYEAAEEGSYEHDYDNDSFFGNLISFLMSFALPFIGIIFGATAIYKNQYGYKDNKKIDKKNTLMFRDIPCNKDIYYANALILLNNFSNNDTNILGAILLKWIKLNKITIKKDGKISLVLNKKMVLDNELENKLFDIIYEASVDGILETKELTKWAKKNYSKFFDIFKDIKNNKIEELKNQNHIYKRTNKKECKFKNVMDDTLYEESKKLYGLKLFLEEFSSINTKEAIEVHLWDHYLMFAYLFGIADKVMKQFKNMYPEIITEIEQYGGFDTFIFINSLSTSSYKSASSARSAAESYSSGGGGFSSGGGGGGSFGGGGGGSR